MNWKEVTKDEFYKAIGNQDVHPTIINSRWPYTSHFKTRAGRIVGAIESYLPEGSGLEKSRYLLPK